MMVQKMIEAGNRAVVISANDAAGPFSARLYVNCRDGIASADATLVCGRFKTLPGAERWASKRLA